MIRKKVKLIGLSFLLVCITVFNVSCTASLEKNQDSSNNVQQDTTSEKSKEKKKVSEELGPGDQSVKDSSEGIILGCPTDKSVTIKAIAKDDRDIYFEYGKTIESMKEKTRTMSFKKGDVIETELSNLSPDTQYYYRMLSRKDGTSEYVPAQTGTFHTQRRRGEAFVFTIQADPHRDQNSDILLYERALQNVLADKPDFHIDLGDTFMSEKLAKTKEETLQRYMEDRGFFVKISTSVPLFLVNGNHEGEWSIQKDSDNVSRWAVDNRKLYFPNPLSNGFYTGNKGDGNYYSFNWGDALFIMLDPFSFSEKKAQGSDSGWNMTLGKTQYDWLKNTLENSSAKYKFVFTHNLVGGYGNNFRGGAEAAKFLEWGGYNWNEKYDFDNNRPGWGKPIHQLLVENKVTAVFHGHDHFYAKQELDGIIYQLVPQPSHPGKEVRNAAEYSYKEGVFLPPAGHLRVTVSPEQIKVDYVRALVPKDEKEGYKNGDVVYSYTVSP